MQSLVLPIKSTRPGLETAIMSAVDQYHLVDIMRWQRRKRRIRIFFFFFFRGWIWCFCDTSMIMVRKQWMNDTKPNSTPESSRFWLHQKQYISYLASEVYHLNCLCNVASLYIFYSILSILPFLVVTQSSNSLLQPARYLYLSCLYNVVGVNLLYSIVSNEYAWLFFFFFFDVCTAVGHFDLCFYSFFVS